MHLLFFLSPLSVKSGIPDCVPFSRLKSNSCQVLVICFCYHSIVHFDLALLCHLCSQPLQPTDSNWKCNGRQHEHVPALWASRQSRHLATHQDRKKHLQPLGLRQQFPGCGLECESATFKAHGFAVGWGFNQGGPCRKEGREGKKSQVLIL